MKISLTGPNNKKEEAAKMAHPTSNTNSVPLPHTVPNTAAPGSTKEKAVYPDAPSNECIKLTDAKFIDAVKSIYYQGMTSNPAGLILTKLRGLVFMEVGKYKKRAFSTQEIAEFDKIMFDVVFDLIDLFISNQRCTPNTTTDILARSEMACMVVIKNGLQITDNWNNEDPNYMSVVREFLHEAYSVFFDPAD